MDEETESQKGKITIPRSHSKEQRLNYDIILFWINLHFSLLDCLKIKLGMQDATCH